MKFELSVAWVISINSHEIVDAYSCRTQPRPHDHEFLRTEFLKQESRNQEGSGQGKQNTKNTKSNICMQKLN